MTEKPTISPITVDLTIKKGFASFTNSRHLGNRIGYRIFEHTPMVWGSVPKFLNTSGIDPELTIELEQTFQSTRGVSVFKRVINGEKGWIDQDWTYYFKPVKNGVEMLWVIGTRNQGLPAFYGVQQCFRMGGKTNRKWKRGIAETPAFSEYDLWQKEGGKAEKTSLTWALRKDQWILYPAHTDCVGSRTPHGQLTDQACFGDKLPNEVGPYMAHMLDPVDSGLITRTDITGCWVSGIYWQRTSHLTAHHPADCLHSIVDTGGIPPHSKRALRGKIYWFEGTKKDLLEHWRHDFPKG